MARETIRIDARGLDPNIRSGGRAAHIPEGDYLFKVVGHEKRKSERSGNAYVSWQMQCVSKPYVGKTIYHITSLKTEALWNIRNLIFACTGKNIAGNIVDFNPQTIYNKIFAGTTEDDSYVRNSGGDGEQEVIRSVLADIRPKAQLEIAEEDEDEEEEDEEEEEEYEDEDEEEDEEEEPAPKRAKAKSTTKSKRKVKEEEEDLEEIDVDEI